MTSLTALLAVQHLCRTMDRTRLAELFVQFTYWEITVSVINVFCTHSTFIVMLFLFATFAVTVPC